MPDITLNNALIQLGTKKEICAKIKLDNLKTANFTDFKELSFDLILSSKYLAEDISINSSDKIRISENGIYTDGIRINFMNSYALISGNMINTDGNYSFAVKGKNLPVYDIERSYLLFIKQVNNKKMFIENFRDFKGKLDVNLVCSNDGINGALTAANLGAVTVPLSIPLDFKKVVFNFKDKNVFMQSKGIFGGEPVETDFYLSGLMTDDMEISGSVNALVTNDFAKKYIENLYINGTAGLSVDYAIKDGIIDIIYAAKINKESDISYSGAALGLIENDRILTAVTRKTGDIMTLTDYSYEFSDLNSNGKILTGNGQFSKKNGKYSIDRIKLETMENAPVSLLGFLESRLLGGKFSGNLEFDFNERKLTGAVTLSDSGFKGFEINNAAIFANDDMISILAVGTFQKEIFNAVIELKNKLESELLIYNLDLFLKKFEMKQQKSNKKFKKPVLKNADQYPDVTIKQISLRLDEFRRDKIVVENLLLNGSAKNHILDFTMPDSNFADGTLNAKGKFDFNKKYFIIDFEASDIDANTASYQVFNLKDHIEGKTGAKLHAEFDSKGELKGSAAFNMKEGTLTQFGSKEFIINGRKKKRPFKFSISDIIKVDKKAEVNPYSDIKGYFNLSDDNVKDINLIVQNDAVSLYLEGDYNIKSQMSDLNLWGKYDKEIESQISILHIPLSFIFKIIFKAKDKKDYYVEKLLRVPPVKTSDGNEKSFNVEISGNLNNLKSLDLKFKSIR